VTALKLDDWLEAAASSARRIASEALGASQVKWVNSPDVELPGDLCGVFIPLITDHHSLQLGVLGTRAVCSKLASALLGEPVESDEDVLDAVGEVTNLIAGNVKADFAENANLRLGLPLAVFGRVVSLGATHYTHGVLTVDGNDVCLVMTMSGIH
jgi:Chemotaxis phosphatase CheX